MWENQQNYEPLSKFPKWHSIFNDPPMKADKISLSLFELGY